MVSAIQSKQNISLQEFLKLPETKPALEYIDGVIYQKPMPQGEHSIIQTRLSAAINQVGEPLKSALAFTELRCTFGGRSIVPDIAVFEWERIPRQANGRIANRFEICPDWTIEILSPDQTPNRVINKILFCIQQGAKLGWFIDPGDESVMSFQPNRLPEVKYGKELLPVLSGLGNWELSVADLFSWLYI